MSVTAENQSEFPIAAALVDQLTTAVALLDRQRCFIHANPAFVDLTSLARWRGCPLDVLGEAGRGLAELIDRACAAESTLALRGFDLATRDPPLRVDVAVTAWGKHVILELHAQGQQEAAIVA